MDVLPSIFESFNARALEPHQVARTFVPPGCYSQLLRRQHTIIVGPRGSGKTTLLKMLQAPALEAWEHPDADECRAKVDFTGVFVPADRAWSAQIDAVGSDRFDRQHRSILGIAAFTTHVLRALIAAMRYRVHPPTRANLVPHRRVALQRTDEAELVAQLSAAWYIEPAPASFLTLEHALSLRLSNVHELASMEVSRGSEGRGERLAAIPYLHLHFLTSVSIAVRALEQLAATGPEKWALLFDEFELAPVWIRNDVLQSLRSFDDRLLFKVSLCPFTEDTKLFDSAFSAMPGHDYEVVPLWYAHKEDGYEFCRALFKSMLAERRLSAAEPEQLLGRSAFETAPGESRGSGTAYGPNSRLQKRFINLAEKDSSFKHYLTVRNIDPRKLHVLSSDTRAAEIRKVTSLVAVREAFRNVDRSERGPRARTRKNPTIYGGATSLFAIVEGNPRWLIGIVTRLLDTMRNGRIDDWMQAAEVAKACKRFRALLRTIPCASAVAGQSPSGVLSILDPIGKFFFEGVVKAPFNPDPYGSFFVDREMATDIEKSLADALNAGAIVYVPEGSREIVITSLRERRFRLCYLLAPYYRIPIRLGRPMELGTILRNKPKRHRRRAAPQPTLFSP
jgi:hypothetical protein